MTDQATRPEGSDSSDQLGRSWASEPVPTHHCTVCGAMWRRLDDGSWNLRSESAGHCCNNVPMVEQIEPLTLGDLAMWLNDRWPLNKAECQYLVEAGKLCRKCGQRHAA